MTLMPSERDKARRRFTVFELLVYVSALSVTLGLLRAITSESPSSMTVAWFVCSIGTLGALIGTPVAIVLFGRQHVIAGASLGAVAIWPLLYVLGIAYNYMYPWCLVS